MSRVLVADNERDPHRVAIRDFERRAALEALEVIRTVAAVMGSGGVLVAAQALQLSKRQAGTTFEDAMAREYRDIAYDLPQPLRDDSQPVSVGDAQRRALFRYFDLSNEQLRLINDGRIGGDTAEAWKRALRS